MKLTLILFLFTTISFLGNAQESNASVKKTGVFLNSAFNSEVYPIRLVPGVIYYLKKSQLEGGLGFHPFIYKDQRIVSAEFYYKYFPNGRENKFNLYLFGSFVYLNQLRKSYYPATYHYLILNGGYGFQISLYKGVYLGTNVGFGTFAYRKRSENPYHNIYDTKKLVDEFGVNLGFQTNISYRF